MNTTLLYCFLVFVILYWNTVLIVQLGDTNYYLSHLHDSCYLIKQQQEPLFTVLTYHETDSYTSVEHNINLTNCHWVDVYKKWTLRERPIVGDHIHMGMVLSVNDQIFMFHDRNMSQPIPYEDDNYTVTCPSPGDFAYEKRWYHNGVHTHCDGIIHVHPWSAPDQLRVEGRKVRLKMWFESVGMEVSPDKQGLKLPGQDEYIYDWNMEYYIDVTDDFPVFRSNTVEEIINLWLVDHHGEILLWSGGDKPKKDYRVVEYKSHPINYPKRYI